MAPGAVQKALALLKKYKEICNVLRKSARFEDIVRRRHNRSLITKLHLLRVCNPLARSAGVFVTLNICSKISKNAIIFDEFAVFKCLQMRRNVLKYLIFPYVHARLKMPQKVLKSLKNS